MWLKGDVSGILQHRSEGRDPKPVLSAQTLICHDLPRVAAQSIRRDNICYPTGSESSSISARTHTHTVVPEIPQVCLDHTPGQSYSMLHFFKYGNVKRQTIHGSFRGLRRAPIL